MSLLELESVTLRFGGLVAVNNVSLAVSEGEVFAIVGPNGAGKSTIFNLVSRVYTPRHGDLRGKEEYSRLKPPDVPRAACRTSD